MAIFRGIGGAGDSTTDATVTEVTQQAVNAANSATAASTSASSAATSASNASTSATNAANSATSASNSASTASDAATAAQTAQTNAETAETNAESAQTAAEAAQTAAELAETNAETAYDNFDDRYLGSKTSDPSVDNDGDALITGALYFNTTDDVMKVYNGTSWLAIPVSETYTGTVTSVGGTGTVNGLTLTGTVTTSGNLTLGGTLSVQAGDIDSETATDGYVLTADGAGNAAWEAVSGTGTVTSVSATVPTGFTISGSPIISSGTLAIGFDTGYVLPTTASQTNWNTAYGWGDHSTAGYLTSVAFGDLTSTPTTLSGYGITDAATSAQGALADSALQPNDNISTLTNDAGYTTNAATSAQGALADSALQPNDNISTLTNDSGYTTNTGTVTSVSGTGTVNGLTLAGTVTTSGDLTLGGTLAVQAGDIDSQTATDGYVLTADGAGNAAWEVAPAGYTDSDVDTHLNTATASSGEVLSWTGTDYDWIAAGGGGASALTIDTKSAAYTVVSGDLGKIINFSSGSSAVATLPDITTVSSGFHVSIWNTAGTNVSISVKPAAGQQIGSSSGNGFTNVAPFILEWGVGINLVSDGTYWHISDAKIYGNYKNTLAIGSGAKATNNWALAIGATSRSDGVSSIAIGSSTAATTATANNGVAIGNGAQAVTGANAMALGNSRASGVSSFAAAITNNTSTYGATGANSVAIGDLAKATNTGSVAIGDGASASGSGSVALGYDTVATSTRAYALSAYGRAEAVYSATLFGARAKSSVQGKAAYGPAYLVGQGEVQGGMLVCTASTSDATATALTTTNSAASATNQVILPNNSAYAFHGIIVARIDAASGTNCAAWKVEGLIRREGSAGTTVLVNSATTVLDNTPAWGMALSADTTNGGLAITVTGAAATNIRWVATVHTSEVTYA
jgi:trimeric autotransporter adhesin